MRLANFERIDDGTSPRFVARVEDAAGAEPFELTVAGPPKLVEQVLADGNLDLEVDSAGDDARLKRELDAAHGEHRRAMWSLAALDDLDVLLKPSPPAPRRASSVFASARPVSGDGTPFAFTFSGFFVPAGVSFFLLGSWVITTFATLTPASGDQDLFLRLFAPSGPVVAASRFGGTTRDTVAFGVPVFPFVPVFQVVGFAAGVCSTFVAIGA